MGTNYYEYVECCDKCNRPSEKLHIGKSSMGWPFSVHIIQELGINSWLDWCKRLESGAKIFDEYERKISLIDLHELVVSKRQHANDKHVLDCYKQYPHHCNPDPATGDKLSSGDFS